MTTSESEALGDGGGTNFREMAFSIEKVAVTARSRALKAEYSLELAKTSVLSMVWMQRLSWQTFCQLKSWQKSTVRLSAQYTSPLELVLRTTLPLLASSIWTWIQTVAGLLRSSRVCCSKSSAKQTLSPKRLVEERATSSSALLTLHLL